jgi:SsrA-binding protein
VWDDVRMALIENKKVRFDYEILETFETGIELLGFEVKTLRNKQGSLEGAFVSVRGGEAFLVGATIPPYQQKNSPKGYDAERTRKLLLTKKEIAILANNESKKGLTIVPVSVYNKGRKLKLEIAVVRGKKKHDKRQSIKKRETEREIDRTLKYE